MAGNLKNKADLLLIKASCSSSTLTLCQPVCLHLWFVVTFVQNLLCTSFEVPYEDGVRLLEAYNQDSAVNHQERLGNLLSGEVEGNFELAEAHIPDLDIVLIIAQQDGVLVA